MAFSLILQRCTALFACLCLLVSGNSVVWARTGLGTASSDTEASVVFWETQSTSQITPAKKATNKLTIDNKPTIENARANRIVLAQADTELQTLANPVSLLDFDITAPTIKHTPSEEKGTAGTVQTVVAEINDNQAVKSATLVYRNSSADSYSSTDMNADATNTTWLATIDTITGDTFVNYYIVAEDTDGNRVQKGSESNPLTVQLQESQFVGTAAPVKKSNKTTWIAIGVGVLLVGALAASGGGGGGGDGGVVNSDSDCCTITFTVPNVDP